MFWARGHIVSDTSSPYIRDIIYLYDSDTTKTYMLLSGLKIFFII